MGNVYPLKVRIWTPEPGGKSNAAQPTRVDVYDDIGEGNFFSDGLTAKDFSARLAAVKGALDVHINSAGGDVFDGIAISSAIRAHKGRVTTVVDGLAASIASVIAQAGQDRIVQPGGMLMVHDAFGLCVGDAGEMVAMAETLDKVSDNIAGIYASRSGRDQAFWRDTMKSETWFTAEDAVAAGLADRVGDGQAELPDGMDLAAFAAVPGRIAAALRKLPQAAAPPGDEDGEDKKDCPTCKGKGKILQGKRTCPDCNGTGDAPDDDDSGGSEDVDGVDDRARRHLNRYGRILGIESMPFADKALPVHHTATTDEAWDGPAAVAAMPNDDTVLEYCHAWEDSAAASVPHKSGDDDADAQKASYKFPHHKTKGGPANLAACRNGLARLSSASIPSGDDAGVKAHLNAHLSDGGGHPGGEDHAHSGISGVDLEKLANALKGAFE